MKRFQKIYLWLVMAVAAYPSTMPAPPLNPPIIFQFDQTGGGTTTTVTGSGSANTNFGTSGNAGLVGFGEFAIGTGPLFLVGIPTLPTGWVALPGPESTIFTDAGSTLSVGGVPLRSLRLFNNVANGDELFLYTGGSPKIPENTPVAASGSAVFANPYTSLFDSYAMGTVLEILPGTLHFIINGNLVVPIATGGGGGGGGGGRREDPSVLVANLLAMYSAEHSGMYWGHVINRANQAAADAALRGIFADGFESGDTSAWTSTTSNSSSSSSSSSLLRYMAFIQDENMSYKVALGLADPDERTIEVNMADTLSAQTGANFNGQTLGGGLTYAMMGVPMMPMAGGAATVHIVDAAPSGKTVIDDAKSVVEADPMTRWELFAAGDFGLYDQDQLTDLMEAFDTETYAGSIGLRYRINDWLKAGFAWSYVESDTNASGNLGNMDLDGNMATVFTSGQWKQNWFELLYSYGSFNNEVRRNTGLGSTARGDTDSDSNNLRIQIGHNIQGGNNIMHGPVAGFRYGSGDVDPYSETGGGSAALDYDGSDFESSVSRVGWQVSHVRPTGWGRIVCQVNVAWEHEFTPENGTVSGSLQTSPFALVTGSSVRSVGGFSTSSDGGAHPGTDWMAAGVGLRFVLDNGFSLRTDYEGAFFRSNASQHYGSLKVGYEW